MQMLETLYLMENVHGEGHTVRTWHGVESQPPYIIQVCSRGRLLTRFYTGIIPLCVRMVSHWFCSRGFTQVSHGFTLFYMVLRGFRIDITRAFCSTLVLHCFTMVLLTPVLHSVTYVWLYIGFAHTGFPRFYPLLRGVFYRFYAGFTRSALIAWLLQGFNLLLFIKRQFCNWTQTAIEST
jgi:hypothetical protein